MSDKFGLVSWDENVETGNQNRKRDDYMRLQSGSNRLRLVTKPFQYWVHKWKEEGMQGFGEKVYCSKFHGSCPCCDAEDNDSGRTKPKRRWFTGVIDRKTGTYKILDMGVAIYQKVQGYSRDEDWGDPSQYDVDIVVNKQGGATGYYNVIAKPKTPLSDADVEIKQNVDLESLKRKCLPPSTEAVEKRLAGIRAKISGKPAVEEADVPEAEETLKEESGDMVFPPADAQSETASA